MIEPSVLSGSTTAHCASQSICFLERVHVECSCSNLHGDGKSCNVYYLLMTILHVVGGENAFLC